MTIATDRLIVTASLTGITEMSGRAKGISPGSTAESVTTPQSFSGRNFVMHAPAAINSTAIGNFGISFLERSSINSAASPSKRDGRFSFSRLSPICMASSKNSPTPALPPKSFGTCIRMIVVQIPVIKPPITGAEI